MVLGRMGYISSAFGSRYLSNVDVMRRVFLRELRRWIAKLTKVSVRLEWCCHKPVQYRMEKTSNTSTRGQGRTNELIQ